jgi:hypothetical protein
LIGRCFLQRHFKIRFEHLFTLSAPVGIVPALIAMDTVSPRLANFMRHFFCLYPGAPEILPDRQHRIFPQTTTVPGE